MPISRFAAAGLTCHSDGLQWGSTWRSRWDPGGRPLTRGLTLRRQPVQRLAAEQGRHVPSLISMQACARPCGWAAGMASTGSVPASPVHCADRAVTASSPLSPAVFVAPTVRAALRSLRLPNRARASHLAGPSPASHGFRWPAALPPLRSSEQPAQACLRRPAHQPWSTAALDYRR